MSIKREKKDTGLNSHQLPLLPPHCLIKTGARGLLGDKTHSVPGGNPNMVRSPRSVMSLTSFLPPVTQSQYWSI